MITLGIHIILSCIISYAESSAAKKAGILKDRNLDDLVRKHIIFPGRHVWPDDSTSLWYTDRSKLSNGMETAFWSDKAE